VHTLANADVYATLPTVSLNPPIKTTTRGEGRWPQRKRGRCGDDAEGEGEGDAAAG
jgi:hypothetical protein